MSSEQQMDLCAPFTVEDVRRAVFDIDETKVAGLMSTQVAFTRVLELILGLILL